MHCKPGTRPAVMARKLVGRTLSDLASFARQATSEGAAGLLYYAGSTNHTYRLPPPFVAWATRMLVTFSFHIYGTDVKLVTFSFHI